SSPPADALRNRARGGVRRFRVVSRRETTLRPEPLLVQQFEQSLFAGPRTPARLNAVKPVKEATETFTAPWRLGVGRGLSAGGRAGLLGGASPFRPRRGAGLRLAADLVARAADGRAGRRLRVEVGVAGAPSAP